MITITLSGEDLNTRISPQHLASYFGPGRYQVVYEYPAPPFRFWRYVQFLFTDFACGHWNESYTGFMIRRGYK